VSGASGCSVKRRSRSPQGRRLLGHVPDVQEGGVAGCCDFTTTFPSCTVHCRTNFFFFGFRQISQGILSAERNKFVIAAREGAGARTWSPFRGAGSRIAAASGASHPLSINVCRRWHTIRAITQSRKAIADAISNLRILQRERTSIPDGIDFEQIDQSWWSPDKLE
jgi:hypothetical protein